MNRKLYDKNGYVDIGYILDQSEKHNTPYIYMVGGRGTGKTYGALRYTYENRIKIMYMRRTQTQHDMIRRPELSPYKSVNRDINKNIEFFPITKYNSAIYNSVIDEKGKPQPEGDLIGMTCALSTISNMRGFDASDLDIVVYDEFIPERHERPMKNEASALFNALETIGRNRELNGMPPLKLLALANANNISNEIFMELGLVGKMDRMIKKKQRILYMEERGIMLVNLKDSPISEAKEAGALYLMTRGTQFYEMSLHNNFSGFVKDAVKSEDLRQYKLIYVVGELAIYKHKSMMHYYVSTHISGTPKERLESTPNQIRKFWFEHREIWVYYVTYKMTFENYTLQILFEKYHKMK